MAIDQQTYQPDQQLNLLGAEDIVAPEELVPGRGAAPTEPLRVGVGAQPETGEVQVAGGGRGFGPSVVEFLRLLGVARRGGDMPPTLIEEGLPPPVTPEGAPMTYRQEREQTAERLLSPEGNARRKAEQEAARQEAEQKIHDPEGLMKTAQQAADYERRVEASGEGGMAPKAVTQETTEELMGQLRSPRERAEHLLDQDDFNLDNMTSPEDVQEVIAVMGERLRDVTEQNKRGVQPHEVTEGLAADLLRDEAGFTKKMLKRGVGETLNAEQMTALRVLLQKASKELDELSGNIASGNYTPEDLIRFRRKMAITAGLYQSAKGAQTEIARAMNAFNIPVGFELGEMRADLIADMLRQSGGADHAVLLAKGYREAVKKGGTSRGLQFANRGWESKAKALWMEALINGHLSWLKSQMKNLIGNGAFIHAQLPEDILAGGFAAAERQVWRARQRRNPDIKLEESIYVSETWVKWAGYKAAMKEAFILAYDAGRREMMPDTASKVEMSQFKAWDAEFVGATGLFGKFMDVVGKGIRIHTTMLGVVDTWFKAISQRGELYAQAMQAAKTAWWNGETREEAIDRGLEVMIDPRRVAPALKEASEYNTMTSDLGRLGKITREIQQTFIGRTLIPFAVAPSNGVFRVGERHPILAMVNPGVYRRLTKGTPRQRAKAAARLTVGTAATMLVFDLAQTGRCTGSRPRTESEVGKLPNGWQPYACAFRGEDWPVDDDGDPLPYFDEHGNANGKLHYWNYAGIEPIGAFMAITIEAHELMRRTQDEETQENILAALVLSTVNYIEEGIPMLQGLGAVMKMIEYDDIGPLAQATTGGLVTVVPNPLSAMFRNLMQLEGGPRTGPRGQDIQVITEDDLRDMPPRPDGELQWNKLGLVKQGGIGSATAEAVIDVWHRQVQNLPFLQDESNTVVRLDVYGEPYEDVRFDTNPAQALWNSIMPIRYTTAEELPEYKKVLNALGMPLKNPGNKFDGVRIDAKTRSDLIFIAKNVVTLPVHRGRKIRYTFREGLQQLLLEEASDKFYRDNPELEHQQRAIAKFERAYFEDAWEILQEINEHYEELDAQGAPIQARPNLTQAVEDRGYRKEDLEQ